MSWGRVVVPDSELGTEIHCLTPGLSRYHFCYVIVAKGSASAHLVK